MCLLDSTISDYDSHEQVIAENKTKKTASGKILEGSDTKASTFLAWLSVA